MIHKTEEDRRAHKSKHYHKNDQKEHTILEAEVNRDKYGKI